MKTHRTIRFLVFIVILTSFSATAFAQRRTAGDFEAGLERFSRGDYTGALSYFQDVLVDETGGVTRGNAYFWLAKTHLALGNLADAEKNLEYFLVNFETNENFDEALYQKGRLLYLQKEYENALKVLYGFIERFPDNPYTANAYYWTGESLYALGHLDKAERVFKHVVTEYPGSFKVEASKYKLDVIELKRREEELLKFLKWSHEESLETLEEFQIREKTYEQALGAYQRKLSRYEEEGTARTIEELTIELRETEAQVSELQKENARLEEQLTELQARPQAHTDTDEPRIPAAAGTAEKMELLELKEQALALKEYYLEWLLSNAEE
ncbi:MAG: tetratricopeptide repeat protein [Spirochaetia bacterium]